MNDIAAASSHHVLKPVLGTLQLLGMAVGLVIFGWSYGWATAGTLGFMITSLFIERASGPSGGDLAGEY